MTAVEQTGLRHAMGCQVSLLQCFRATSTLPVGGGKPIATGQRVVNRLIELKNGVLISGGKDGTLRRWKDGVAVGDGRAIE